ncbi:GNAT family N-acetyltransferase [Ruegeria sp. 2205SS24-7]|uniref:GNAT family N-acetyltransferase n=1 Tax=Ruegeria discodermiae TaxID=3064389 RepID=UPI0027421F38|nr:GNAT family N-acetyltransferase [Ruegeria sp. 2205SS24-7]MDP5218340.1 GNAT family N-acetyltransferase [Ruegeria sp. 2205SS24-7]
MSTDWPAIVDGTWPAARYIQDGAFLLREGQGGGSRVSATTAQAEATTGEIASAEERMRRMGQKCLFMIRSGDTALDAQLDARGYRILDPVNIYICPVAMLTDTPVPRVTVFAVWEPLAVMNEIWARAGIGPARWAVMQRASGPKTGLLIRRNDKPAGTGFAAIHDKTAMVHALEILPEHQRNGLGKWAMRAAAFWALDNGAETLSVICTKANTGANALYHALGMQIAGSYHYRVLDQTGESA